MAAFLKAWSKAIAPALTALGIGSLLSACVLAAVLAATAYGDSSAPWLGVVIGYAGIGFALGLVPALLYGAPVYGLLTLKGHASYWSALGVGAVPGFLVLLVSGIWVPLVHGCLSALVTHFLARFLAQSDEDGL